LCEKFDFKSANVIKRRGRKGNWNNGVLELGSDEYWEKGRMKKVWKIGNR